MSTAVLNNVCNATGTSKLFHPSRRNPTNLMGTTINCIPSLSNLQIFDENKRLYSSGAYYIGNLEGCRRNGWGTLKWSKGCSHEGYYLNNKKNGEGIYTWDDGSLYKGDFKNDLRHGYGELTWPNGESYTGYFADDMRHGFGVYTWPGKGKYEGNFEKNKKYGYGVFTFENGDVFEGFYKDDQRWGPGIFSYSENSEQDVGIWKGKSLIRVCSVIDDAFLYEHLKHHFINAGLNIPTFIKDSNSARNSVRSTPDIVITNCHLTNIVGLDTIPPQFGYRDIIDGIRTVRSSKGKLERSSEMLLNASSVGDLCGIRKILEEGLVSPNVMDKTGFSSLLAAAVNCHSDAINVLLDHGANINQLTDEGLSALLACHILLYTDHNFVENIAEQIPDENLFNTTDIERKTGAVVNRIDRKMIMSLYEDIFKPFITLKKAKPTFTKKLSSKKRFSVQTMPVDSYEQYLRASFCYGESISPVLSEPDEHRLQSSLVSWKVDYYKKSMDHIKEVEAINTSFKELMTDPHACYTSSLKATRGKNRIQSDTATTTCEGNTLYGPYFYHSSDVASDKINKDGELSTNEKKDTNKFFSTTVASHFGYNPTSMAHTVEEQKRRNNELVLKLLNNERRPHLQNTISLLLKRGADPNVSNQPMSALFYAVKSADPEAVQSLLQQSADTSARLKFMNLSPLHIAVALPCAEGLQITKLLLQYGADPNIRDTFMAAGSESDGRTPLHIVCSREDNYKQTQKIARLLLEYKANPDLLCAGNSPLSLAIASGNDLIVDTLLQYNANPSLKLTHGLGSILCVAVSFQAERRRTPSERIKLIEKLIKSGADMLTPVRISDKYPPGTVVDYGYHVFTQDRRISCTPYHALSSIERECFNARKDMLDKLGIYLREAAIRKEQMYLSPAVSDAVETEATGKKQVRISFPAPPPTGRDENCGLRFVTIKVACSLTTSQLSADGNSSGALRKGKGIGEQFKQRLRYCYECGRSIGVRLSACTRCKEVFYCGKGCKVKAWNIRHREECAKLSGHKSIALQSRSDSPTPTSDASATSVTPLKAAPSKSPPSISALKLSQRSPTKTPSRTSSFLPQI